MLRLGLNGLALVLLMVAPVIGWAQAECSAWVDQAVAASQAGCQQLGRNQVCYGNVAMEVEMQADAAPIRFEQVGDVAEVNSVKRMILSPLEPLAERWGVAIMKLQANIPNTLPGQNVTFVLFGGVEVTNAVDPHMPGEQTPMQAFVLRQTVQSTRCDSVPADGMLVQTPQGVRNVSFQVNGIDIQAGSTVNFQPGERLKISTLEGAAYARSGGGTQVIVAGTTVSVPLDEAGIANAAPGLPEAYTEAFGRLDALPLALLGEGIEIAEPLDGAALESLLARIQANGPLCGGELLPACDAFPGVDEQRSCIAPGEARSDDDQRAECPDSVEDDGNDADGAGSGE
jgi:hypothetical protein